MFLEVLLERVKGTREFAMRVRILLQQSILLGEPSQLLLAGLAVLQLAGKGVFESLKLALQSQALLFLLQALELFLFLRNLVHQIDFLLTRLRRLLLVHELLDSCLELLNLLTQGLFLGRLLQGSLTGLFRLGIGRCQHIHQLLQTPLQLVHSLCALIALCRLRELELQSPVGFLHTVQLFHRVVNGDTVLFLHCGIAAVDFLHLCPEGLELLFHTNALLLLVLQPVLSGLVRLFCTGRLPRVKQQGCIQDN
mmetsp:Transcript_9653/g.27076  ORF Transcript_9653/g.27076 Transcript_9653/m.27076 type:complete len:252 (+) Transcript_9653:1905-2660(+)